MSEEPTEYIFEEPAHVADAFAERGKVVGDLMITYVSLEDDAAKEVLLRMIERLISSIPVAETKVAAVRGLKNQPSL